MSGEDKNNTNNSTSLFNMNDRQCPCYISSADHPRNIVPPIILKGENYANMSRIATNALKSKTKFCFVDGSLTKAENKNPKVHAWEKCISMVIAWLYIVIDKKLHGSIVYEEQESETWMDIKEHYLQGNEIRVHQLKSEITLTTQDNLNVTEYFPNLKELWNELGAYQRIAICSCLKDFIMSNFQKRQKVHQFLLGLDSDKFGVVRSNILATEPLPNLNKAYSMS